MVAVVAEAEKVAMHQEIQERLAVLGVPEGLEVQLVGLMRNAA